ncbi:MIP/aquaporin family protein [Streptomyces sp. NPDC091272]|uniref:MIP/aquaporin family protein n=1 Tax=Streptomyces sp. NPDC091272 TaxID=3365981 RepID=UPI0037F599F0
MSSLDIFTGETIGTAVLILLGGGVCAAVSLKRSKALNAGWVAVTLGWGFAVMTGAYISTGLSGAHLNPAVTVGLAIKGDTEWSNLPVYFAGQILGAMIGSLLVWVSYYGHFRVHLGTPEAAELKDANPGQVHGVFFTSPEVRNPVQNMATEVIATVVLVLAILTQSSIPGVSTGDPKGPGVMGALITAFVVVGIGLSLGGPTGYAINPVRDLGPRIVHALLPLPNKGGSDWGYAWIPVLGPLVGGALAGGIYQLAFAA